MWKLLSKFKKSKSGWKKIKDLRVGMKIAVPRAGLLAEHLQSRPGTALNAGQGPEPDVQWDEIVVIKPLGREQVYDIEVEGSHNFVGNNIFAHNTYISGNVGIGSSTPSYKLAVEGEVAAQAFVNISTATEKKDIAYLTEDEDKSILEKIRATNVAAYNYKTDVIASPAGAKQSQNQTDGIASSSARGGLLAMTGKQRLGLIAENAPAEVLAAGGKGVDLYKLGTFVLAGLKAESKEREAGVLALDTRIAAEMAGLKENVVTKRLSVLGSANGDLLYIATGEASRPSADIAQADVEPSLNNRSLEPIFRITAGGEVVVRDDIVFAPRTSVVALNEPQWVVALSEEEAQMSLRPAPRTGGGGVIVVGAADGVHVYNAKTHKEMSGYTVGPSVIASPAKRDEAIPTLNAIDSGIASSSAQGGLLAMTLRHITADYFTQTIDHNTLAQYPFRTLADATGRGNDLSMTGSVSLAAEGVRGTAAAFDGSGYLSASAASVIASEAKQSRTETDGIASSPSAPRNDKAGLGAGMTIGAWVKFNSLSSNQKIISQDGAFSLALGEGGKAEVTAQGAGRVATRKSLAALDNDWHYVVASYSALKARLDIYMDGAIANGDLAGEIPLTGLGVSSEPVKLGAGLHGVLDDAFISAGDVDVSSSAALASSSVIPAKAGIQTSDTIRTNYLVGRKALNYGLAATSGLQAQPTSAAVDRVNNVLYVGTADGQIITVDLGASAVVGKIVVPSPFQGEGRVRVGEGGITSLAVASGAGRTLAAIVGNQLWLDTETVSVRDSLAKTQIQGEGFSSSVPSPFQGEGRVRVGEGSRRVLTVFEDLLVTGGKILPEASSGLPLFAITSEGVAEGLAFRDVSFANELVNASFEYWEEVPSPSQGEGISSSVPSPSQGEGRVRVEKPLAWQGSKKSADAKFGLSSIQITDGVLSTTVNNASDFASSTVTLSAWVKTDKPDDVKLVIASEAKQSRTEDVGIASSASGLLAMTLGESAYHSGSGQWERLIVTTQIPSPLQGEGGPPASQGEALRAGVRVQITSASKTALVDGVMLQRGWLPTAFVPSNQDTLLANPQYLNFTASIAAASSSPSFAGPTEGLLAKLPAGTFANTIRIDQLSVGFSSVILSEAGIQIIATNGIDAIVCAASGSSCRQSGSLTVGPGQELLVKYSVQGMDAGSASGMTIGATVNLRYYPAP